MCQGEGGELLDRRGCPRLSARITAKAHKDRILRASRLPDMLCSAASHGSICLSWYEMNAGPFGLISDRRISH